MGSVVKRGKKFGARAYIGYVDSKRQYKWLGTFDSEREAKRAIREVESLKDQGVKMSTSRTTVDEYMRQWLSNKELEVRYKTFRKYKWLVEKHIIPNLGPIPLEKLEPGQLQTLYTKLQTGENKISKRSILHMHNILHLALKQAMEWGKIQRNVTEVVKPPRPDHHDVTIWSPEQLRLFLKHTTHYRYGIVFYIAAMTGMRKAEICGLKWRDIDLNGNILRIHQTLVWVRGEPTLQDCKTTRSKRTISLDDSTIDKLNQHRRRQIEEKLQLGASYNDEDYVIAREDGRPVYYRTMDNQFVKCIEEADVPRIRFHDLRHTHASLLIAQGVPINVVSERLGHAQTSITMNIYAHTNPDQQRKAAESFASSILGGNGVMIN